MAKYITFLGKFDKDMGQLEENIINYRLDNKSAQFNIFENSEKPNVIKKHVNYYNCDVYVVLGNVKPTMLLKKIIEESDIILFIYNSKNSQTLDFLIDGWGYIIEKVDQNKKPDQKRYLFGTKPQLDPASNNEKGQNNNLSSNSPQMQPSDEVLNKKIDNIKQSFNISKHFHDEKDLLNELNLQLLEEEIPLESEPKPNYDITKQPLQIQTNKTNDFSSVDSNCVKNPDHKTQQPTQIQRTKTNVNNYKHSNCENIQEENQPLIQIKTNKTNDFSSAKSNCIKNLEYKKQQPAQIQRTKSNANNYKHSNCENSQEENQPPMQIQTNKTNNFSLTKPNCVQNPEYKNQQPTQIQSKETNANYSKHSNCEKSQDNENQPLIQFQANKTNDFSLTKSNCVQNPEYKNQQPTQIQSKETNANYSKLSNCEKSQKHENQTEIKSGKNKALNDEQEETEIIKDTNNFIYKLYKKRQMVELIEAKNANGDFALPNFAYSTNSKYRLIGICQNAFKKSCITSFSLSDLYCEVEIDNFTISSHAFDECRSLKKININIKSSLTLSDESFNKIISLESVEIKCGGAIINGNFFNSCFRSANQDISNNLIKIKSKSSLIIGDNCFNGLKFLKNIQIESNELTIGDNCFNNCFTYKSSTSSFYNSFALKIDSTSINIGNNFLNKSQYLTKISIKGKIVNFKSKCFQGCQSLTSFNISNADVISFSDGEFEECDKLQKLSITSKSKLILSKHFLCEGSHISELELSSNEVQLDKESFETCSSILSFTIKSVKLIDIYDQLFYSCNKLKKFTLQSTESINLFKTSFYEKKELESIDISTPDLTIHENCFENCNKLKSTQFNKLRKIKICDNSFSNCESMERIWIEAPLLINIGNECFSNSSKLESITFISDNVIIGLKSFNNCHNLSLFTLQNVIYFQNGYDSFIGCDKLKKFYIKNTKIEYNNYFEKKKYLIRFIQSNLSI